MSESADRVREQLARSQAQSAMQKAEKAAAFERAIKPVWYQGDRSVKQLGQEAIANGEYLPNLQYEIGSPMMPRPTGQGRLRVDNRSRLELPASAIKAPIKAPIKILLQKGSDLYIGGDRAPEKIYTIPTGSFFIESPNIKNTGTGKGDYIINFTLSSDGILCDFCSIKNGVFSKQTVNTGWQFQGNVINEDGGSISYDFVGQIGRINFDNDFALVLNFSQYVLENYNNSDRDIFLGYKNSQINVRAQYVDLASNTNQITGELKGLTLANNGIAVNFAQYDSIPISVSKRVRGQLVIFTYGSAPDLSGGTNDRIYSSTKDAVLIQRYETNKVELYYGSGLGSVKSYGVETLNTLGFQYRVNLINEKIFTKVKSIDGTAVEVYIGDLGNTITTRTTSIKSVPFDGYNIVSASFYPIK